MRGQFDRIAALVDHAVAALERGDLSALGGAMNETKSLLAGLDVSCAEIEAMCGLARAAGALGCKLTGGVAAAASWHWPRTRSRGEKRLGTGRICIPFKWRLGRDGNGGGGSQHQHRPGEVLGQNDEEFNLPAVPSLSLTLEGLRTRTAVGLDPSLPADRLLLNDADVAGEPLAKVSRHLDRVAAYLGLSERPRALVRTDNNFPTAAGLASSASAFARVVRRGSGRCDRALSSIAMRGPRLQSWPARDRARPRDRSTAAWLCWARGRRGKGLGARDEVLTQADWPELRMVIGVASEGAKATGSTDGMRHTAASSPAYFAPFVAAAPNDLRLAMAAVHARDPRLSAPSSSAARCACMHQRWPPIRRGLSARRDDRGLHALRSLRSRGWRRSSPAMLARIPRR